MNRKYNFNKISIILMSFFVLLFCGAQLVLAPVAAEAKSHKNSESSWVSLPQSERSSFAGIHGGTTPVSVMGSEKEPGKEVVSGRTGQDFVQVLEGDDASSAEVVETDSNGKAVALVPYGLGETQTENANVSHLARADRQSGKGHGVIRLKVDDLKLLGSEEAPVSPESLLMADELTKI